MQQNLPGGPKKMNNPKVSIVITTRNRPRLLALAIESVLAQTYRNCDLHVIDDASSDKTPRVAADLLKDRKNAYYWRHSERKGLAAARNTAIAKVTGRYIAFLDDDDTWKPDCLQKRINLLMQLAPEHREKLGVIYCGCEVHIVNERRITYNMPKIQGNIRHNICTRDLSTIPSSCLFPRAALTRIGGFDENLCSFIDHDIWMHLAAHGYYAFAVHEPLVTTYIGKNHSSMVAHIRQRIQGAEQYLAKWTPTLEQWLGSHHAKKYIQRYRTQVLGTLAATKFAQGELRDGCLLVRHITNRSHYSPTQLALLTRLVARRLLRSCVPPGMIDSFRKIVCKNRPAPASAEICTQTSQS